MKTFYFFISAFLFFVSCTSTKDFLSRSNQDKALLDAVSYVNKNPDDANAKQAISILYPKLQQQHLENVEFYKSNTDISRWDKMMNEFSTLQKMYEAIVVSPVASGLVKAENYQSSIIQVKQAAAEDYYQQALRLYNTGNKSEAKIAYALFQKSNAWINGYKDVQQLMNIAWQNAIINIVVNPLRDNSWVFSNKWNAFDMFSFDNFHQSLVRELGGTNAIRFPARFFTEWDAKRNNIMPDWYINISFQKFEIPRPQDKKRFKTVNKQIADGRDSVGLIKYKTVSATLTIYEQTFVMRGKMDLEIIDFNTRRNLALESYTQDYFYKSEFATYTGDRRAIDESDWRLINNKPNQMFISKEEVANELYRRLYPQIKIRIENIVRWN